MATDHEELRFPDDPADQARPPRCLGCGYRLRGLGAPACPECGRRFDPGQPRTYTFRRPYVWYRYWWPGVLLSLGCGLLWAVFFYGIGQLGWGLFIGLPWMLGALLGYRVKLSGKIGVIIGPVVLGVTAATLVGLLLTMGLAGFFCGGFLLLFLIPIGTAGLVFGVLCARALTVYLKQTAFSQREYLPLLVVILLLPGAAHTLQLLFAPPATIQTVTTTYVLDMDRGRAWDAWVFYEEVDHDPPLLLRMGLPLPSHVEGRIRRVGDREVCVYTGDARLVKQATDVSPGERLAFDVVGQHHFENNSIRLIDGAFEFEDAGDGTTRVTLTTRYEPLLRPRALWQPIEHTVAHTLHRHVLSGMQARDAEPRYSQRMEVRP